MKINSFVIVNLTEPKEQFWGLLLDIKNYGITIKGINVNSFEDWARQVRKSEKNIDVITIFFPMHRIEKIFLDENMGILPSMSSQFKSISGIEVNEYFKDIFEDSDID